MAAANGKTLAYGYRRFPEGVRAVWGARLIEPNDLLHDRQDLVADDDSSKADLIDWLNGETRGQGALARALERLARHGFTDGCPELQQRDEEFPVYEDERGKIVGNTQASYGYVYVAGWLHEHVPEAAR